MSKRFLCALLALTLALACTSGPAFAVEPPNLYPQKLELMAYVNSGEYAKDVAAVALRANKYLVKRIPRGAKGKKMAVVFDIDETTLTNLRQILANDFGYVPKVWESWVAEGRAPAVIPVQIIYDTAVRNKVDVFFITGRRESDRPSTEKNLREVGYETWTKIYFKPEAEPDQPPLSARGFKIDVRRTLVKEGYVIIANIGDQDSDLAGGYAQRTFKLPNPFYIVK